jgi:hypothetical protein
MTYKSGYRYITQCAYVADLPATFNKDINSRFAAISAQQLIIMSMYAWDGASFILFQWCGTPARWLVPSLIHDALYQLVREGLIGREHREAIDRVFYAMLRERGVSWLVATGAYYAVRIGGNFAVRKTNPVREVI